VVHEGDYRSIHKGENIFSVDLKRALELLAQPKRMRGRSAPLKELGAYPGTQDQVHVHTGKYGPYLKVGTKNISLPDDMKIEELTLEAVLPLIQDKLAAPKTGGKPGKTGKTGKNENNGGKKVSSKTPSKTQAFAKSAKTVKTRKAAGRSRAKSESKTV
ncbi:MAG: topoisomerase C-terminal repeat-containing protein, partial [Bdellovibrionales bacterium]